MKQFFKALYRGWMKFAHVLGRINTAILLTLFYFLFLGLAKLITVISRADLLDNRWKDRPSFWRGRKGFKADKAALLKPY